MEAPAELEDTMLIMQTRHPGRLRRGRMEWRRAHGSGC
jgi:hypothetical protein